MNKWGNAVPLIMEWLKETYPTSTLRGKVTDLNGWVLLKAKRVAILDVYYPGEKYNKFLTPLEKEHSEVWELVASYSEVDEKTGFPIEKVAGHYLFSDPEFFKKLKKFCDEILI